MKKNETKNKIIAYNNGRQIGEYKSRSDLILAGFDPHLVNRCLLGDRKTHLGCSFKNETDTPYEKKNFRLFTFDERLMFLEDNERMTTNQICEKWKLHRNTVIKWRRILDADLKPDPYKGGDARYTTTYKGFLIAVESAGYYSISGSSLVSPNIKVIKRMIDTYLKRTNPKINNYI